VSVGDWWMLWARVDPVMPPPIMRQSTLVLSLEEEEEEEEEEERGRSGDDDDGGGIRCLPLVSRGCGWVVRREFCCFSCCNRNNLRFSGGPNASTSVLVLTIISSIHHPRIVTGLECSLLIIVCC